MSIKITISVLTAALALTACQQKEAEKAASAQADPGVAAVLAEVSAAPNCSEWTAATPRKVDTVALSGDVTAYLADCAIPQQDQNASRRLYVRSADGVLKNQYLLIYNGDGYAPDYTWEGIAEGPVAWDAAKSEMVLTWNYAARPAEGGEPATPANSSTVRWRWAGDHFVMVSSTYSEQAAAGGPVVLKASWPSTPPIDDPTSAPTPVGAPVE